MSSISSLNFSNYTQLLATDTATSQIDNLQQQIQTTQEEITTGNAINNPSDNPGASAVLLQLNSTLTQQTQYLANVQQGQTQLGEVDSSLSSLNTLLTQATTIASQDSNSTVTSAQRAADATVVQTLYSQALSVANTQFEGSYIFGGDKSNSQPYVSVNGGVQFVGSNNVLQQTVSPNTNVAFQVSAASVFGAPSQATGSVDLTPALTNTTRISDLKGANGTGVSLGTIQIGNGTTSAQVDLSGADTIGDVVNDINNAHIGNITASISGDHLVLGAGGSDNVTVNEVGGGSTAQQLGILHTTASGAGVSVNGASVQPAVTDLTPLSALRNSQGISAAGLTISNGTSSATVNLSGATTVGDLINAINGAGVNVQAQINAAGNGINIVNTIQGTTMTVGENGGTTAADLGVRTFSPSTQLSSLNNGQGLQLATSGADFTVTNSAGASFSVSLAGAKTVQDIMNDINTAAGSSGVVASFATSGNGIVLTDSSSGTGALTVSPQNFSNAAASLGLTKTASGNIITGSDTNPVAATGIFSDLAALQKALQSNDTNGITQAGAALTNDAQSVTVVRGQAGARVQELQNIQDTLTSQNTSTQALVAQIQGADMPATIEKFTNLQTALQAALQVTARTMNLSLTDYLL